MIGITPETRQQSDEKKQMADARAAAVLEMFESGDMDNAQQNIDAMRQEWEQGSGTSGAALAKLQAELGDDLDLF